MARSRPNTNFRAGKCWLPHIPRAFLPSRPNTFHHLVRRRRVQGSRRHRRIVRRIYETTISFLPDILVSPQKCARFCRSELLVALTANNQTNKLLIYARFFARVGTFDHHDIQTSRSEQKHVPLFSPKRHILVYSIILHGNLEPFFRAETIVVLVKRSNEENKKTNLTGAGPSIAKYKHVLDLPFFGSAPPSSAPSPSKREAAGASVATTAA